MADFLKRFYGWCFQQVHLSNIVYNTSWEDPAVDRAALSLSDDDRIFTIASAGDNALDYILAGAGEVHAVDMNPHQIALVELKKGAALALDYEDFFQFFGKGFHKKAYELYHTRIRPMIGSQSQVYWDKNICLFFGKGLRRSFYRRGTTGFFSWIIATTAKITGMHPRVVAIFTSEKAKTREGRRELYSERFEKVLFNPLFRFFLSSPFTLSLLGVPLSQAKELRDANEDGIPGFIQRAFRRALVEFDPDTNYFYRLYILGNYSKTCCPEYLKKENYEVLRIRLAEDRLKLRISSINNYLQEVAQSDLRFSGYSLLDHMDWMAHACPDVLSREWDSIFDSAAPGATIIFRSAGVTAGFLKGLKTPKGKTVLEALSFDSEKAAALHEKDRVGTYGSFFIAKVQARAK